MANQVPTEVNLQFDLTAPALKAHFDNYRSPARPLILLESGIGLARNCCSVAVSALGAAPRPANAPDCAVRLTHLLMYFELVLESNRVWIEPQIATAKANTDAAGGLVIDARWDLFQDLVAYLHAEITNFPIGWNNPAAAYSNRLNVAQPGVPSEGILELLVQYWVWVAKAAGTDLSTNDFINTMLRQMCGFFLDSNATKRPLDVGTTPRDFYLTEAGRNGLSACVFTTTRDVALEPDYLVVGSTSPLFVDAPITRAFQDARKLRMDMVNPNQQTETTAALANPAQAYTQADTWLKQQEMAAHAAAGAVYIDRGPLLFPNVTRTNRVKDAQAAALPRAPPVPQRWTTGPFNHQNQRARSYFSFPFYIPVTNNWFEFVPRCLKCRVIQDYPIPEEDDAVMNGVAKANPALQCAEDMVHAKLRAFQFVVPALNADPVFSP